MNLLSQLRAELVPPSETAGVVVEVQANHIKVSTRSGVKLFPNTAAFVVGRAVVIIGGTAYLRSAGNGKIVEA